MLSVLIFPYPKKMLSTLPYVDAIIIDRSEKIYLLYFDNKHFNIIDEQTTLQKYPWMEA